VKREETSCSGVEQHVIAKHSTARGDFKQGQNSPPVKTERFSSSSQAAAAAAAAHQSCSTKPAGHHNALPLRSQDIDWAGYLTKFMGDESNVRRLTVNTQRHGTESSSASPSSTAPPPTSTAHLPMRCSFCENNGEDKAVFMSHPLKDSLGKVVCPILRLYKCPKCGEAGDYAHTNKYCPETQRKQKENKIRKCFEATTTTTPSKFAPKHY
jgi:hypothetical protein